MGCRLQEILVTRNFLILTVHRQYRGISKSINADGLVSFDPENWIKYGIMVKGIVSFLFLRELGGGRADTMPADRAESKWVCRPNLTN